MKIQDVLVTENAIVAYRDLTDAQATVLIRVTQGKSTFETGSPREQAIMDELASLGLLNDLSYEPTNMGAQVASMAARRGPRDARVQQQRLQASGRKPVQGDGKYSEVGDTGDGLDADDGVNGVSGDSMRTGQIMR